MDKIKFNQTDNVFTADIKLSGNVVSLTFDGNTPSDDVLISGFVSLNEYNDMVQGNFIDYKTIYNRSGATIELSNNGSIYVEPVIEEVIVPEPTAEELELQRKNNEIMSLESQITSAQSQLDSTDYYFIKTTEETLLNKERSYTDEFLISISTQRDEYRSQINVLQSQLEALMLSL